VGDRLTKANRRTRFLLRWRPHLAGMTSKSTIARSQQAAFNAEHELAERRRASYERATRAASEALRELRARRQASESAKAHSHKNAA